MYDILKDTEIKNIQGAKDLLFETFKLCKSEEFKMIVGPTVLGERENFKELKKPNLVSCKIGEEPGEIYENCCPINEFNQFVENIDTLLRYTFKLEYTEIKKIPSFYEHLYKDKLCGINVKGFLKLTQYETPSFINGLDCQTKDEKDFLWSKTILQLIYKEHMNIKENVSNGVSINDSVFDYFYFDAYNINYNSSSFLFIPLLFLIFFKIIFKKTKRS